MLTTRSMSWRTLVSRSGVLRWPRKYLLTTTLVASWDQKFGDLDVLLLEDGLAALVGDAGRPVLPGDLVVGMDTGAGPAALERQALGGLAVGIRAVEARAIRAGVAALGRGLGGLRVVLGDRAGGASGHLFVPPVSVRSCHFAVAAAISCRQGSEGSWGLASGIGLPGRWRGGSELLGRVGDLKNDTPMRAGSQGKNTRCSGTNYVATARCGGLADFVLVHARGRVVHAGGAVVHAIVVPSPRPRGWLSTGYQHERAFGSACVRRVPAARSAAQGRSRPRPDPARQDFHPGIVMAGRSPELGRILTRRS